MEIINVPAEMNQIQKRALILYCESATILKDYKPDTFEQISTQLKNENIDVSKSSLQRWSKRFNFDGYLELHLQSIVINENGNETQQKALGATIKKSIVDIERNNELTADCYKLLELFAKQTAENFEKNKVIKRDDIKIIKDIAVFTGGREDKLLDRISNSGSETLSSEELKKSFDEIEIEIESE